MECPSLLPNKGQQTSQGKQNCQEPCHVVPWCVPGTPKMSGLRPRSSVVVTWKAGCGESRTSGLEWGKDREVLPITTGDVAMLSRYPTTHAPDTRTCSQSFSERAEQRRSMRLAPRTSLDPCKERRPAVQTRP